MLYLFTPTPINTGLELRNCQGRGIVTPPKFNKFGDSRSHIGAKREGRQPLDARGSKNAVGGTD